MKFSTLPIIVFPLISEGKTKAYVVARVLLRISKGFLQAQSQNIPNLYSIRIHRYGFPTFFYGIFPPPI